MPVNRGEELDQGTSGLGKERLAGIADQVKFALGDLLPGPGVKLLFCVGPCLRQLRDPVGFRGGNESVQMFGQLGQ